MKKIIFILLFVTNLCYGGFFSRGGDNLGNHKATKPLDMSNYAINGSSEVNTSKVKSTGSKLSLYNSYNGYIDFWQDATEGNRYFEFQPYSSRTNLYINSDDFYIATKLDGTLNRYLQFSEVSENIYIYSKRGSSVSYLTLDGDGVYLSAVGRGTISMSDVGMRFTTNVGDVQVTDGKTFIATGISELQGGLKTNSIDTYTGKTITLNNKDLINGNTIQAFRVEASSGNFNYIFGSTITGKHYGDGSNLTGISAVDTECRLSTGVINTDLQNTKTSVASATTTLKNLIDVTTGSLSMSVGGEMYVANTSSGVDGAYFRIGSTITVTEVTFEVLTAPTGADLIFNLTDKAGTSYTGGNVTMTDGTSLVKYSTPFSVPKDSWVILRIVQIGTTTSGSNLAITMNYRKNTGQ